MGPIYRQPPPGAATATAYPYDSDTHVPGLWDIGEDPRPRKEVECLLYHLP
jgi:hypothetical protein